MAYFDEIKVGDKVWSLLHGWGTVVKLYKGYFEVNYKYINGFDFYTLDGKYVRNNNMAQILFWDEIKFEIPQKQKIELKESKYRVDVDYNKITKLNLDIDLYTITINNGLTRNDKETAEQALEQIKRFTKLLALRDQECEDSRGYEFKYGGRNYYIYKDYSNAKKHYTFSEYYNANEDFFTVYFATIEDTQKICDILNKGKFDLEE